MVGYWLRLQQSTMEAKKLESLIKEKGIKQTFIAKKLNVSRSQVNHWTKGIAAVPEKYVQDLKYLLR